MSATAIEQAQQCLREGYAHPDITRFLVRTGFASSEAEAHEIVLSAVRKRFSPCIAVGQVILQGSVAIGFLYFILSLPRLSGPGVGIIAGIAILIRILGR